MEVICFYILRCIFSPRSLLCQQSLQKVSFHTFAFFFLETEYPHLSFCLVYMCAEILTFVVIPFKGGLLARGQGFLVFQFPVLDEYSR